MWTKYYYILYKIMKLNDKMLQKWLERTRMKNLLFYFYLTCNWKLIFKVSKHVKNRPCGNFQHEFHIKITTSALKTAYCHFFILFSKYYIMNSITHKNNIIMIINHKIFWTWDETHFGTYGAFWGSFMIS